MMNMYTLKNPRFSVWNIVLTQIYTRWGHIRIYSTFARNLLYFTEIFVDLGCLQSVVTWRLSQTDNFWEILSSVDVSTFNIYSDVFEIENRNNGLGKQKWILIYQRNAYMYRYFRSNINLQQHRTKGINHSNTK